MSGLISVEEFKDLVPTTSLSDSLIGQCATAAQAIAEQSTGLVFGADVTALESLGDDLYRLAVGSPLGDPGRRVLLLGDGVPSQPVDIFDIEPGSVTVVSAEPITAVRRALPIIEFAGKPRGNFVYCDARPIHRVISVQTRAGDDVLWSDSENVQTLTADRYEVFRGAHNLPIGVMLQSSAIPRSTIGRTMLVKTFATVLPASVKVTYAAGFYAVIPADLQTAAVELINALAAGFDESGRYQSESIDYYSYQRLDADQVAALPHSSLATFRRYAKY